MDEIDSRQFYKDILADEDIAILEAITAHLSKSLKFYRINLENGHLTNMKPRDMARFAGVDQIESSLHRAMEVDATTEYELVMPTAQMSERTKIGELFGCAVYADPDVPPDRFVIKAIEKES